jgi:hypothetical protein
MGRRRCSSFNPQTNAQNAISQSPTVQDFLTFTIHLFNLISCQGSRLPVPSREISTFYRNGVGHCAGPLNDGVVRSRCLHRLCARMRGREMHQSLQGPGVCRSGSVGFGQRRMLATCDGSRNSEASVYGMGILLARAHLPDRIHDGVHRRIRRPSRVGDAVYARSWRDGSRVLPRVCRPPITLNLEELANSILSQGLVVHKPEEHECLRRDGF